jgi:hypothetical protein
MLVEQIVAQYPRLYHMAEAGSWPSIRAHGLLSTQELARRSALAAAQKADLCSRHRPEKEAITVPGIGTVVLRDQKPMSEKRLRTALADGMTPSEWYELINARVFFWVAESRLLALLGARAYATLEHDVLTVDTASLLSAHADLVWLCHMNSGNTLPFPTRRGRDTFKKIADYPVTRTGRPRKKVVEFTVERQVLGIRQHVVEVRRMRGAVVLGQLPLT